jgi:ABC-type molybdenum transport system ATPase subunit/photorepair protein PhrA
MGAIFFPTTPVLKELSPVGEDKTYVITGDNGSHKDALLDLI